MVFIAKNIDDSDNEPIEVPSALVREVIDGLAYPYRGWREVMEGRSNREDIMGSSGLQSEILSLIEEFFYREIGLEKYRFYGNESGNHLGPNTNFAFDKAIYLREDLPSGKVDRKYVAVAPHVVIEVDVNVDTDDETEMQYVHRKINKLMEYGVQRVLWIFSDPNKIIVAEPDQPWRTTNWDIPVELVEGKFFNLAAAFELYN